jgi:chaperonin cofactor prefoldin
MENCLSTQNKTQLDRFKEAARELEADDDEARFNKKLGKLVKKKPDKEGQTDK